MLICPYLNSVVEDDVDVGQQVIQGLEQLLLIVVERGLHLLFLLIQLVQISLVVLGLNGAIFSPDGEEEIGDSENLLVSQRGHLVLVSLLELFDDSLQEVEDILLLSNQIVVCGLVEGGGDLVYFLDDLHLNFRGLHGLGLSVHCVVVVGRNRTLFVIFKNALRGFQWKDVVLHEVGVLHIRLGSAS